MLNNQGVLVDFPNWFFIRNSVLLTSHIFKKTTRTGKVHFAVCDKIGENLKFTLSPRKHAIRWIPIDSPAKISHNNLYNYTTVSTIIQSKSLPGFRIVTSLNSMLARCFQTSLSGVCNWLYHSLLINLRLFYVDMRKTDLRALLLTSAFIEWVIHYCELIAFPAWLSTNIVY